MPATLRARLLFAVLEAVEEEMRSQSRRTQLGPVWGGVYRRYLTEHYGVLVEEPIVSKDEFVRGLRDLKDDETALEVYGFVQAMVRLSGDRQLSETVARILEQERSAYRLVDGDTLVPFGSEVEAQTLSSAISDAESAGLAGAVKHLKLAGSGLSAGNFADSVRESVHAVESAVRVLSGEGSVSTALKELAKRRQLHPAFTRGVMQLYGFGSDEPGVRHPLLESGDANVREEDAMFMLGTCASLVTYFARSFGGSK
jgi:hypothetical protein